MALVISNVVEEDILESFLETEDLFLRLYSNNIIPAETDTAATFTQVAGGGYVAIILDKDNWAITPGAPTVGLYAQQSFSFTGVTNAPGTIYGYYVVNAGGFLQWAERFPGANVPFSPINNSIIRITPRVECS